ncbi:MAG: hypothetical protein AUJ39_01840 [Parcubacteria group bacterium CG1_02_42_13]|nr:MAG: hypothetical protein AUJ39_01840 [Parcubacteria group bacterium CG1_02_42_13]
MTKNISITITVVVLLLVVAIVGIVIWQMQSNYTPPTGEPVATPPPSETPSDSTTQINQSLDDVDLGNLDQEFQQIDADLNSL